MVGCKFLLLDEVLSKSKGDAFLAAVAENKPEIELIGLSGCSNITDVDLEHLARSCNGLTSINLNSCSKITDAGLEHLARSCSGLTSINLSRSTFDIRHMAY